MAPSDDDTINLTSSDTTEGMVEEDPQTFTSDNWDIVQTATGGGCFIATPRE